MKPTKDVNKLCVCGHKRSNHSDWSCSFCDCKKFVFASQNGKSNKKVNRTLPQEKWEKRFDRKWAKVENIEDFGRSWTRDSFKAFIKHILEVEHKSIKKELDYLVPVQNNDKHNDALLRLLNRFI